MPAGCGLCSGPVSPLDGAAAFGHHRGTAVQPDPEPAAELGVQPALGSPPGPFPASWQDGTKLRDTAPSCHLPEAPRQVPVEQHCCASRGHGGTEGMRNPSPAIPGLSVLGRARPGSARGRCWQSAAEGGGEGTDPGGAPVPCGNPAPSVRTGPAGGAEMSPRCSVGAPARLTHPQDGRDAVPKARGWAGQRVHTEPQLPPAAQPQGTRWDPPLLQDLFPVRAISSLQRDISGLGIASRQSELGWVWQPP